MSVSRNFTECLRRSSKTVRRNDVDIKLDALLGRALDVFQ